MRDLLREVRRIVGAPLQSIASSPLQAVSALCLGLTLGVAGALTVAPFAVSANDDAGVRGIVAQDARARHNSRIEQFFQPLVRSFAPQPRFEPRRMPAPIHYGYAPRGAEPVVPIDRTGASQDPARRRAATAPRQSPRPAAAEQPRRTVCVRLCDGYHFPIGNLASSADLPAHDMACQSQCPGAPVKLFTLAAGAESVEEAVSRDLRSYASLAVAFNYRKSRSASCSCQPQGVPPSRMSLARDFTLRPGDAVVAGASAQVFNGGAWPFRASDFSDFRASRRIAAAERRKVDSLVGVSHNERLLKPFTVARGGRDAPVAGVAVVRPTRSAEVRRVDGPGGRRTTARILAIAAASSQSSAGPSPTIAATPLFASAPAAAPSASRPRVAGPAIIEIERAMPPGEAAASPPAGRELPIVVRPGPSRQITIVETRSSPGFVLR